MEPGFIPVFRTQYEVAQLNGQKQHKAQVYCLVSDDFKHHT